MHLFRKKKEDKIKKIGKLLKNKNKNYHLNIQINNYILFPTENIFHMKWLNSYFKHLLCTLTHTHINIKTKNKTSP